MTDAGAAFAEELAEAAAGVWRPPPRVTVSDWCDAHRVLSREASAEPGPWRTDRAPHLREPLDAVADPTVEAVTCMFSSQVGKSEILLNATAWYIGADPAPMLLVEPTIEEAEQFSKTRVAPMLRDSPTLAGLVADPKARDSGNTLRVKEFPGGHLTLVGANSPAGLAAKPIRIVLFDEVDRAPASAGAEGDPVTLAEARTSTFWNRKHVKVSSPTIKGVSRIEQAYLAGSQASRHVPCPHCGAMQPLVWRHEDGRYGLVCDRRPDGTLDPATARYACVACGALIEEKHKRAMLASGVWVHAYPERTTHRSYRLSQLYSPWKPWAKVMAEFLEKKDSPMLLKGFVNTTLGEPWEEAEGARAPHQLAARAEPWDADVPDAPVVLTLGVDVQVDRLEAVLLAHGADDERWTCWWRQIPGDPQTPDPWVQLDALRTTVYRDAAGRAHRVVTTAVDTAYQTERAMGYCLARTAQRVLPIRGVAGRGRPLIVFAGPERLKRGRREAWHMAGDTGKDLLNASLGVQTPGPGYWHFHATLDPLYYDHLTAEAIVTKYVAGRPVRAWAQLPNRRNDALDATIIALAAWSALGTTLQRWLLAKAAKRHAGGGDAPPPPPEPMPMPVPAAPRAATFVRPMRRGGWMRGY